MPRAALLLVLLLAACQQPSRETVQLAGELRRSSPGSSDAMADRPFDCDVSDRACVTLWLHRGAACARLAEAPTTPDAQRPARRDCAVQSFTRASALMPADATADERLETGIRLADALERQRDRAFGAQRQADNTAILAAIAPLRTTPRGPGDGYADYFAAGVALNRVQAGDIPAADRCAALAEAREQAASAAEAPGLPPLGIRIGQRRAAVATQIAAQTPRCP
jgi:hypothetical protein